MKNNGLDLLADYVFHSKYSQRKENGKLETWNETVDRIYDMHTMKLKQMGLWDDEVASFVRKARTMEYDKKILSSQRGRQFASVNSNSGILKHEAKLYNCCSTLIDRVEVFSEIIYLLLCGCGVGYSLHKGHVDKLPSVPFQTGREANLEVVEDSIEGWADAVKHYMGNLFSGIKPNVSLENIRPEGTLIDGKFTAPGPEPLRKALNKVMEIILQAQGRRLTTLEIHDMICFIAESVVSGGVRRSAMIALFDKEDELMLKAKTGNWWVENPQRAMANNSILTTYDTALTYKELNEKLSVIRQFGEPGFVNVKDFFFTVNPCGEIVMLPRIDIRTGFAFCNLVEINAERVSSKEEFYELCEIASFVATVQALYTNFKYLSRASRDIAERDRAVGVSITGMLANHILVNGVLQRGAKTVAVTNHKFALSFGINPSRTCTTIKPSGNASSILGLYCSGIHPAHAHKYLRRVRIKTYSPEFNALKDTPLVKVLRGDEAVISFPIISEDPELVTKDDMSAVEHLKYIAMVKHYWINKGGIKPKALPNNVSATVEVCNDEWGEVAAVLFTNDHLFTGVSLLPSFGDQVYDNAPFQRLSSKEVQEEFDNIFEYLQENEVDFNEIMSRRENLFSGDMAAIGCSGGACELK